MGEISQELITFKEDVIGNTDGMNDVYSELSSKVALLSNATASARSEVESNYNSQFKNDVLSGFDITLKVYNKINESLDGTLKPMIEGAKSLIKEIEDLEKIKEKIGIQQEIIRNNNGDSDTAKANKANAQTELNKLNDQLNVGNQKALDSLSALRGVDGKIDLEDLEMVREDGSNGVLAVTQSGTFQKQSYTASNGVVLNYYMYLPKFEDESIKKPMLAYFHGIQDTVEKNEKNNFINGGGLAGLIERGLSKPNGIALFYQATDGTVDNDFITKPYQDAVIEHIKATAEKYNGDLNRVSVAGHSNGGAAAQHIVNNNPGFFAAAALMGISSNAKEGIAQTNLYALVGSNDHTMEDYGRAIGYARKAGKMYKVYGGMGHDIQTIAFQEPVADENGNSVMLVDWLMSKSLKG